MIPKKELKGKYIVYRDRDGATRIGRVVKLTGNVLTVTNAYKTKHRVKKDKVIGRQFRKKGVEEIQW